MISCSSDDDLQDIATRRPGILIIDPCKPKLAVEAPADLVARVSPTTALIGYCSDPASAQARCIDLAAYRGLMPQTVHSAELVRIVISVAFGGIYVHENYAERLIRPRRAEAEQPANGIRLTEREEEVLRFVARGSSAKEIAAILHLSAKTVDTYKTRANAKLNLRSRSDIVRYAIRSGWME